MHPTTFQLNSLSLVTRPPWSLTVCYTVASYLGCRHVGGPVKVSSQEGQGCLLYHYGSRFHGRGQWVCGIWGGSWNVDSSCSVIFDLQFTIYKGWCTCVKRVFNYQTPTHPSLHVTHSTVQTRSFVFVPSLICFCSFASSFVSIAS